MAVAPSSLTKRGESVTERTDGTSGRPRMVLRSAEVGSDPLTDLAPVRPRAGQVAFLHGTHADVTRAAGRRGGRETVRRPTQRHSSTTAGRPAEERQASLFPLAAFSRRSGNSQALGSLEIIQHVWQLCLVSPFRNGLHLPCLWQFHLVGLPSRFLAPRHAWVGSMSTSEFYLAVLVFRRCLIADGVHGDNAEFGGIEETAVNVSNTSSPSSHCPSPSIRYPMNCIRWVSRASAAPAARGHPRRRTENKGFS